MNQDSIYQKLKAISDKGNLRKLPDIIHTGGYIEQNGRTMLNLSSNDYLGLSTDLSLRKEFLSEITPESFVPGATSSRLLTGNYPVYHLLEKRLCELYAAEAALVFNSGYHANTGILPTLATPDTLIVSDKLVHASIIDGMRLSSATVLRYRHNRYDILENILAEQSSRYRQIIIVTESIFSMDGDEADLSRLVALKHQYRNVWIYLDEAHAIGVRGNRGLGCAEEKGLLSEIDFLVGTFGKALASIGAFVICSDSVKRYLVNTMRTLIFTTALPPINLAWTLFLLNKLDHFSDHRKQLEITSRTLREQLKNHNGPIQSSSHIIPFLIGNSSDAVTISQTLQQQGFYLLPVRPPTVPEGTARLRISLTSEHTLSDIDRLLTALRPFIKKTEK